MDPQNARIIAERLKIIGDKLEQEHGEERLSSLVNSFVSFGVDQPITITRFLRLLRNLRSRLNWKKVSEVFVVGYRLLEIMTQATTKPFEDERWWLFERLWDFMVNTVARWVMENGGWVRQVLYAFLMIKILDVEEYNILKFGRVKIYICDCYTVGQICSYLTNVST